MSTPRILHPKAPPSSPPLLLPDIPPSQRCDFRRDYDSGMTLKAIGQKYHCDPRTVRRCLQTNRSSTELGHQMAPTKLAPYLPLLENLISKNENPPTICRLSREITAALQGAGYTGSERTVRNYLRSRYHTIRQA